MEKGIGFGSDRNGVAVVIRRDRVMQLARASKIYVAERLLVLQQIREGEIEDAEGLSGTTVICGHTTAGKGPSGSPSFRKIAKERGVHVIPRTDFFGEKEEEVRQSPA